MKLRTDSRRWTRKEDALLRKLYPVTRTDELPSRIGRSDSAIRNRVHDLRLRKRPEFSLRRPWSTRDDARLRKLYPDLSTGEVARQMGRSACAIYGRADTLGLQKSAAYLASPAACRLRRGDNVGKQFRFAKGHVPMNKGLRRPGFSPGRMRETQFKKGQRPRNYFPVGTIKANADGYLRIKIDDAPEPPDGKGAKSKNWEFVHKRVWEAANGPIPKGHRIWWKDRDHTNCALENLELLSDQAHMRRTTVHNLPEPLKRTVQLLGALNRRINRRTREEQDQRSA